MKTLLLLFLLISENKLADSTKVYICNSPGGKKYHLTANCKGLSTCQHRVLKITLEQAKKMGKTLCAWEQ